MAISEPSFCSALNSCLLSARWGPKPSAEPSSGGSARQIPGRRAWERWGWGWGWADVPGILGESIGNL